jgi:hypothetical protein
MHCRETAKAVFAVIKAMCINVRIMPKFSSAAGNVNARLTATPHALAVYPPAVATATPDATAMAIALIATAVVLLVIP